jgi:hypothetical protein
MRLSRSRQPNPLTPFPVKEGGTENYFLTLPWRKGESRNLILWEVWNLSKVPQILSLC